MTGTAHDVIVIGGGIAGVSVAASLASTHRVVVLEAESQAGYHSTGRSAALFSEAYGGPEIRALSRASRGFFFDPPPGFTETSLIRPRGTLIIASQDQLEALDRAALQTDLGSVAQRIDPAAAFDLCPMLEPSNLAGGLFEPDSADVEVHSLHQGYIRQLKARGGELLCDAPASFIERTRNGWRVTTPKQTFEASVVVNAAGAWADVVARMAGVEPIGLTPLRRTALLVDPPGSLVIDDWPLVMDVDESFYFKPDAGKLLLSPADETPTEPGDAQAEEWDVAVAIDRIHRVTTLRVAAISHRWAGLRSFVADRKPVVGFDPVANGFFWLAAQGGYGIQTAPGLSELAASLISRRDIPACLADVGVDADALSPRRVMPRERASRGESQADPIASIDG